MIFDFYLKYNLELKEFSHISTEGIDFLTKLIEPDVSKRLSAKEAYKHRWIKGHRDHHIKDIKIDN